ncbi:hypothetical protein O181_116790 [Austropuccinia psidii MF-1]|uniref:Uncharacterized protein n=1 Tax=Austropuccinia psidii MF-1 TaxID=1389203 RepID=A0A9Q3KD64_9BASI|nr:hypothetical protein [Austropuccinia psidii MF-1]
MRDSFVGPFNLIILIGKTEVEVKFTEEFSGKTPVLPVSLVKIPYHQAGEDNFSSRNKINTPQEVVEVEGFPGPVNKGIKARKIRLNGKDHRQYLVRLKRKTADKDKWLAEDEIPDGEAEKIKILQEDLNVT